MGRCLVLQPLGNDEPRLLRRAAFEQCDRPRLFDAVDIGLRQDGPRLPVELFQARDQDDPPRHAVGNLHQVADGFLEALLGIVEVPEILDLVDAEHERGAIDGPHQLAEAFDDLEGAAIAAVGIERSDRVPCEFGELAALQVLPHAAVKARIRSLQVEQRPDDVDVETFLGELGRSYDIVGEFEDEPRKLGLGKIRLAQPLELLGIDYSGIGDQLAGQPREASLSARVRIVGLLERVDQTPQVIVGIARHVRRHLRVTEIGLAAPVRTRSQRPDEMRLAGTGLAMEQQNAGLGLLQSFCRHGTEQGVEFRARLRVDRFHIDGIGPPDVVLPRDRMLERRGHLVGVVLHEIRHMVLWRHGA